MKSSTTSSTSSSATDTLLEIDNNSDRIWAIMSRAQRYLQKCDFISAEKDLLYLLNVEKSKLFGIYSNYAMCFIM
jgi:hypothetical protein